MVAVTRLKPMQLLPAGQFAQAVKPLLGPKVPGVQGK